MFLRIKAKHKSFTRARLTKIVFGLKPNYVVFSDFGAVDCRRSRIVARTTLMVDPKSNPQNWKRCRLRIDHSVAARQVTPISTGGSTYQAINLGANQEESSAPIKEPTKIKCQYRNHFALSMDTIVIAGGLPVHFQ